MDAVYFVTDLDGTLIPKGRKIDEEVLSVIRLAIEKGVTVIPATGRCLENMPRELLQLSGLRYVISSNGAVIMDLVKGVPIMHSLIPWRQAAHLLRLISGPDIYSCVYANNRMYNRNTLPSFMERPDYLAGVFKKNPQDDLPAFVEENKLGVEKIFVAVWDPEPREEMRKILEREEGIRVTSSSIRNLEITRFGTDKGAALRWLCESLGIRKEQVIVAGDNENDIEMLMCAGTAVVPEGSNEEALRIADRIVPPCEEGGVLRYLREYLEGIQ